jgi:hypothetical protein
MDGITADFPVSSPQAESAPVLDADPPSVQIPAEEKAPK